MWTDYLQHLQGADIWRAAKYVNHRVGATVEAQTDNRAKLAYTAITTEVLQRLQSVPLNDNNW